MKKAAKVKIAAIDKTGTLTQGNFEIINVFGEADTLLLAAAAEHASSHPLAKPFEDVVTPYQATAVREIAGKGVSCEVAGVGVLVGNAALLKEYNVSFTPAKSISTVIYVARDGRFLGYIEIDDKIKEEASQTLCSLKKLGVEQCVMVTGDNAAKAQQVAKDIGEIDGVYAGLLPDEKLAAVETLQREGTLLYVGDGINDAPVMSVADCAFSMGKLGSGAAIEASDFVLVSDSLSAIPTAISVAKKTKKIVMQNIVFSIAAKLVFMGLSVISLPLWLAVFADVGVMLLAVFNSLRMRLPIKNS
ncbi:MAG: HAD-IC family P-type ATPase [Clostridia bacterium]|nr:HAD-IC family P-type ATPase [Clostridia bacterium]